MGSLGNGALHMTTTQDIALAKLFSFTLSLQNMGLIDEKTERILRQDLQTDIEYYVEDKPLTESQRAAYDR